VRKVGTLGVMSEQDGGLRRLFKQKLGPPEWFWETIETGGTSSGVPDSYFVRRAGVVPHQNDGRSCWCEWKWTDGLTPAFKPAQVRWHALHSDAGGRSLIGVRQTGRARSGAARDRLWIVAGAAVVALAEQGVEAVPGKFLIYVTPPEVPGPEQWDWKTVADRLRSPQLPHWP
jgi:hypothetical protein